MTLGDISIGSKNLAHAGSLHHVHGVVVTLRQKQKPATHGSQRLELRCRSFNQLRLGQRSDTITQCPHNG
jgi:hypothetical protein